MIHTTRRHQRRGTVLLFVAFCTIVLFGMLALAIDIGMVAVARSQCQNAADAAACAGARTINGDSANNYNYDNVPINAIKAATANKVLGQAVQGSHSSYTVTGGYQYDSQQVHIETGAYVYVYNDNSPSSEGFQMQFPRSDSTVPYSAVRATISGSGNYAFGRVFGMTTFNTKATAVSAHRPRDVVIIMDLSGSMRFQSLPGMNLNGTDANPSATDVPRTVSMNPETIYPTFGHYSSSSAGLFGNTSYSTGSEYVDPANISTSSNSGPAILEDFYQNASGVAQSSSNRAFSRSADSKATTPGGMNYLFTSNNTTTTYAKTVNDIIASVASKDQTWENYGYDNYVTCADHVEGPGYWGKTFFVWPPDPRVATSPSVRSTAYNNDAKDWRQRFFVRGSSTSTPLDDTTLLFNTGGAPASNATTTPTPIMRTPSSTRYQINYEAILNWIRNVDPRPFPTVLRAGKIKYYDDIPNPASTSYAGLNNRWWTTADSNLTDLNERFWKGYIDFVLGLQGTGAGTYTNTNVSPSGSALSDVPLSAQIGNGDWFAWDSMSLNGKPATLAAFQTGNVNNTGGYAAGAGLSTTISVANLPSSPDVQAGYYVRFGSTTSSHYQIQYRVTSTTVNSSGRVTGVRIDNGNGAGLDVAVAHNDTMTFFSSLQKTINYSDNPYRPRHQFWFGPMTLIDYLGNYNTTRFWWPGNVHEAQRWACAVGIQTAIDDIKKNHPNDYIGMAFFSQPRMTLDWQGETYTYSGQHNRAIVPFGRNYDQLKNSLWFPPTTVIGTATEISPYDSDMDNVPRAKGGTGPGMGLMLAYNMLSSSVNNLRLYSEPTSTYRGNAGGLGRKGATRLVILETDGAPNNRCYAQMGGSGSDSYYKVRIQYPNNISHDNNELPQYGAYSNQEVYDVVDQICALTTASPPGYGTSRKPVSVYPLGYGTLFDINNTSTATSNALTFLQNVAYQGNTATSAATALPDWQRIYGTNTERINRMQTAFTKIMQNGIQITLLE